MGFLSSRVIGKSKEKNKNQAVADKHHKAHLREQKVIYKNGQQPYTKISRKGQKRGNKDTIMFKRKTKCKLLPFAEATESADLFVVAETSSLIMQEEEEEEAKQGP